MNQHSESVDQPSEQIPAVEDLLQDLSQLTGQSREWIIQYAVGRYFFESFNDPKLKNLETAYFKDLNARRQKQTLLESARETRANGGESLLDKLGIDY